MEGYQIAVDSSQNYMKMCRAAVKLQNIRMNEKRIELQTGDWYVIEIHKHLDIDTIDVAEKPLIMAGDALAVWLPTMRQLKDLFSSGSAIEIFLAIAEHWKKGVPYLVKIDDRSGEQLMLAWYMRQRYMEKWNGEKWIKDEPIENS